MRVPLSAGCKARRVHRKWLNLVPHDCGVQVTEHLLRMQVLAVEESEDNECAHAKEKDEPAGANDRYAKSRACDRY
jgi:hypothetical protein